MFIRRSLFGHLFALLSRYCNGYSSYSDRANDGDESHCSVRYEDLHSNASADTEKQTSNPLCSSDDLPTEFNNFHLSAELDDLDLVVKKESGVEFSLFRSLNLDGRRF